MDITELINDIISREWEMFQNTVNEGGRASCQDDRDTFYGMRYGQFSAWSTELLESYRNDLITAQEQGRNLIAEKYLRMMERSAPEEYEAQKDLIPALTSEQRGLVDDICAEMLRQTVLLRREFPLVGGAGRPLYSAEDAIFTSVETYQRGELGTYSAKTLRLLWEYIMGEKQQGISIARRIQENTVKHYGYASLEQAEKAMKKEMEK